MWTAQQTDNFEHHVVWWRCKAQCAKMDDSILCIALIKCVVLEVEVVFPHLWALVTTCYLEDSNLVTVRDMVRLQALMPTWAMDPYRSTQVPASKEMEGGKSKREGYMNQSFITAVSLYHQYSISPLQRKWPFDKTLEKCLLILLFSFWI